MNNKNVMLNVKLVEAAKTNDLELCIKLIKQGANNFNAAMCHASYFGYIGMVKLMLQFGAKDFNGTMFNAAIKGRIEIVKLMLQCGADDFDVAIRYALINNQGHIVNFLKQKRKENNESK